MENNVIMLTETERNQLEKFTKNGSHSARLITRAKVILKLDRSNKKGHLRVARISEEVDLSRRAIYNIRDAFLQSADIETFLTRKKRETPPIEPKITGDVEAKIIATACSEVPEGYSRWTISLIRNKVIEFGYIDAISETSIRTVLKKHNLSLT